MPTALPAYEPRVGEMTESGLDDQPVDLGPPLDPMDFDVGSPSEGPVVDIGPHMDPMAFGYDDGGDQPVIDLGPPLDAGYVAERH